MLRECEGSVGRWFSLMVVHLWYKAQLCLFFWNSCMKELDVLRTDIFYINANVEVGWRNHILPCLFLSTVFMLKHKVIFSPQIAVPCPRWSSCGFKSFSQWNDKHIPSKQGHCNSAACFASLLAEENMFLSSESKCNIWTFCPGVKSHHIAPLVLCKRFSQRKKKQPSNRIKEYVGFF